MLNKAQLAEVQMIRVAAKANRTQSNSELSLGNSPAPGGHVPKFQRQQQQQQQQQKQ
jgi:hypothetical protein